MKISLSAQPEKSLIYCHPNGFHNYTSDFSIDLTHSLKVVYVVWKVEGASVRGMKKYSNFLRKGFGRNKQALGL